MVRQVTNMTANPIDKPIMLISDIQRYLTKILILVMR
jgi:hypothetical protein